MAKTKGIYDAMVNFLFWIALSCVLSSSALFAKDSMSSMRTQLRHRIAQEMSSQEKTQVQAQISKLASEGYEWSFDYRLFFCLDGTAGVLTASAKAAACLELDGWFSLGDEVYFAGYLSLFSPTHPNPNAATIAAKIEQIGKVGFSGGIKAMFIFGSPDQIHGAYTGAGLELAEGFGGEFNLMGQNQNYTKNLSIELCKNCNTIIYGGISFGSIVSIRASGIAQSIEEHFVGQTRAFSPLSFHVLPASQIPSFLKLNF